MNLQAIQNARKRPIELDELFAKNGMGNQMADFNEWKKNKRSKTTNYEQQCQQVSTGIDQQQRVS